MVLRGAFAAAPPPQARNGMWIVQLSYGPGRAPSGPPSVVVQELWTPTGIGIINSSPSARAVQLLPGLDGRLAQQRGGNGAEYAVVTFASGGQGFMVLGPRADVGVVLRVARSLAAAAGAAPCAACRQTRAVASIPQGSGWIALHPVAPLGPGARFEIVPARTLPGGTGRCAGKTFRYAGPVVVGMGVGGGGPVSGSVWPVAYNPATCQVAAAVAAP